MIAARLCVPLPVLWGLLLGVAAVPGCSLFGEGAERPDSPVEQAPTVIVDVRGVAGDVAQNVALFVSLATEPCDAPDWRIERLDKRVEREASDALRAFGFYQSTVRHTLERLADCWRVEVDVEPGEPVTVRNLALDITGAAADDPAFRNIEARLAIKPGDDLNHAAYEAAKHQVSALAAKRGYFDGRFERSEFSVDVKARSADVQLSFDSGARYAFGKFAVAQEVLIPELVSRMFESLEGQPYDADRLTAVNQSLSDVGYFQNVVIRPAPDASEDGAVPVALLLEPLPKHSFSVGAGVTTDAGPRLRVGYENRRVNRRGHRVAVSGEASTLAQSAQLEYRVPLEDPRSEWFSVLLGYEREDDANVKNEALRLGVRQTLTRPWNWLETRFVDFTQDDFVVGDQRARTILLIPGVSWSRTEVDDRLDPARGWRATLDLRGAVEGILSDTSLLRVHANGDWLRRFSWGGRVLARGELGALSVADFAQAPPSQRFFAGGDLSVRGYGFRELGPTDSSGAPIGGRYVVSGSIEYEHPIKGAFSGAAFVDAGNVSNDLEFSGGLGVGVGVGVRWRSPVGPVRVDLAHPLNRSDDAVRVHLRLGPDL